MCELRSSVAVNMCINCSFFYINPIEKLKAASVAAANTRSIPHTRSWPWALVCWCPTVYRSVWKPRFCTVGSFTNLGIPKGDPEMYISAHCSWEPAKASQLSRKRDEYSRLWAATSSNALSPCEEVCIITRQMATHATSYSEWVSREFNQPPS